MQKLITAESVTEGHPDKLADFISDSVLDALLTADSEARVAVETVLTNGLAFITGETRTQAQVDVSRIVRDAVREVGYTDAAYGFSAEHSGVLVALNEQSADIARGVDRAHDAASGHEND
ncbi:MAG TPA: S-adenosylmethionine synthetase N-terminal domain-containing protein, partial [Deinococcales bacterium]|nr:S-adenosylmethionine synthetase N-terminal domain-containing protein [Deinococcales bacterium]